MNINRNRMITIIMMPMIITICVIFIIFAFKGQITISKEYSNKENLEEIVDQKIKSSLNNKELYEVFKSERFYRKKHEGKQN